MHDFFLSLNGFKLLVAQLFIKLNKINNVASMISVLLFISEFSCELVNCVFYVVICIRKTSCRWYLKKDSDGIRFYLKSKKEARLDFGNF